MKARTMVMVGKTTTFAETEAEEILFWASKTVAERLKETEHLRRLIWSHLFGAYPESMEVVGEVVKKDWHTHEP